MQIFIIIGTRPNFIKITQFKKCAKKLSSLIKIRIIHTGQHYSNSMSKIFFNQFNIRPDYFLSINNNSQLSQISSIQLELESLFNKIGAPDLIIVPGDVNSTLAGALTANKMGIKLAHLEAGLRSYDRNMPEEINRIITDELADILFVTEPSGLKNLKKENKNGEIIFVGNTMIDTMLTYEKNIDETNIIKSLGIKVKEYILVTIHRPSNVDSKKNLLELIKILKEVSKYYKIVFPIHPRTEKNIKIFNLKSDLKNIKIINPGPLGYFEFQNLLKNCALILTDSGGIQEESTFRKVPCITLRKNTERPITIEQGTNTLSDLNSENIINLIEDIRHGNYKKGEIPQLWDGFSTKRIVEFLNEKL